MTIAKFVLMGGGVVLLALRLILDLSWMGFAGAILLFAGQLFFPAKPLAFAHPAWPTSLI